ncbi:MAG: NBR1-Ig-like domain-containing protein, partial [Chloroflexota bacterium]
MKTLFRPLRLLIVCLTLAGLVLAACAPAPTAQPTSGVDAIVIYTFAALTNEAKATMQAPPQPTATLALAATEAPPTIVPAASACTDSAELISEEPLDNAVFHPGDKITKRWTLKNIGTCAWNNYRFEFDGKEMGGNSSTLVNQVAPGQTIDLYAYLTAPGTPGT